MNNKDVGKKDEWKSKDPEKWTTKELKQWIKSLNLKHGNELKVFDAVDEAECKGEDVVGCENGNDIAAAFDINKGLAKYLYIKKCRNIVNV